MNTKTKCEKCGKEVDMPVGMAVLCDNCLEGMTVEDIYNWGMRHQKNMKLK